MKGIAISLLLALMALPGVVQAEDDTAPAASTSGLDLAYFRVSQFSIFQGGNTSFSAIINWHPSYRLNDTMAVRLSAGGAMYKGQSSNLILLEGAGLFSYAFTPTLAAEVGGGIQYDLDGSTLNPVAQANVVYHFAQKVLVVIDHIAAGYTAVFPSTATGSLFHEARIGAGIVF